MNDGRIERGAPQPLVGLRVGQRMDLHATVLKAHRPIRGREGRFAALSESCPVDPVHAWNPNTDELHALGKVWVCGERCRQSQGFSSGAGCVESNLIAFEMATNRRQEIVNGRPSVAHDPCIEAFRVHVIGPALGGRGYFPKG